MPAASEVSVRNLLAGMLHKEDGVAGMFAYWDNIVPVAMAEAEAWLRNALAGFGATAVAEWPMFEHYHRRLSVYFASLYDLAILTDDQRVLLQKLDCREELSALEVLVDNPDSTDDDPVSGGLMARSDDLFRRPSVGVGGCLPGDIFNTPTGGCWRDCVR